MNSIDLLNLSPDEKRTGVWVKGTPGNGEKRTWYYTGEVYSIESWRNNELVNYHCLKATAYMCYLKFY